MIQAGRSLAELPERGRVVPELDEPAVREVFVSRYRVIYEVFEDRVAMLRVIHGRRDLLTAWGRAQPEEGHHPSRSQTGEYQDHARG